MGDTYHLKGAIPGGETVPCGEITIPFFINKKQYVHTFIVAELSGDTEIILGEVFFANMNPNVLTITDVKPYG